MRAWFFNRSPSRGPSDTTATMFKRPFRSQDPNSRVDKSARLKKPAVSGREAKLHKLQRSLTDATAARGDREPPTAQSNALSPSPIVTLAVGKEGRIFAAHEDILCQAPFFEAACGRGASPVLSAGGTSQMRRLHLPDEEPEVFSAVLEFLYKGDYYPRLIQGRRRDSWELEDAARSGGNGNPTSSSPRISDPPTPNPATPGGRAPPADSPPSRPEATMYMSGPGKHILRDTAIYCAAERYGLDELKRLSLRKQGLQSGIDVATILRSAQYAYAHTPDSDSRLRAHYLALIIRCRRTFKRSGTMQAEMEQGGNKLFFDLFVAMCNHLDDVIDASNGKSPRVV